MKKIKLIWDFKGLEATKIAEHFHVHLKEFLIRDKIIDFTSELEEIDEFYSMVNLIIDQKYVERIKNALKPKKAYLV